MYTAPIIDLVTQARRRDGQRDASYCLAVACIVICWNWDFDSHPVGGQPAFDLFLRRHRDDHIAFDNRLAGQRIPLFDILGRKAQRTAPANLPIRDLDGAASAASLPTTWLPNLNPGQARGFTQQSPGRNSDGGKIVKCNEVIGH